MTIYLAVVPFYAGRPSFSLPLPLMLFQEQELYKLLLENEFFHKPEVVIGLKLHFFSLHFSVRGKWLQPTQ